MRLSTTSGQEFRNRTIVELYESGKTQKEIAELTDCTQAWVSKILNRYRLEGSKGLLSKGKAKGAKSKLDSIQLEQLKQFLLAGALEHGFATDNWTRERIAALILKEFEVRYHPAHISWIMQKIGFSKQKPVTRSYRKDEKAVKEWKTKTLPSLKKSTE